MDTESIIFWSFMATYCGIMSIRLIYDRFYRPRTRVIIADDLDEVRLLHNNNNSNPQVIIMTNIEDTGDDCPICKEKMEENIIKTDCNHIFHKDCIKSWISCNQSQRYKCPICMQNLST